MKKRLVVLILILGLYSCNNIYNIEINKDGSAHVEQEIALIYQDEILERDSTLVEEAKFIGEESDGTSTIAEDQIIGFLDNPIINNFTWESNRKYFYKSSYDISTVDSLGDYINKVYEHVYPVFKLSENSFMMTCKSGVEEDIWDSTYYKAIFVQINIRFPYKIESVNSNNDKMKIVSTKKNIQLKMKLADLFFRDEDSKVEVKFN